MTTTSTAAQILGGIREWVEMETHSPDGADLDLLMDKVAAGFAAAGAKVARTPGRYGYGSHLTVTSPWGEEDAPGVLVLCHLDTVHPKGTLARDLPFRTDGDKAFGPGIYDMKGGAYLAFQAYREIAATGNPTPLPLRLLYTSDEETGSATSRALIEREGARAKYVLVVEPARDGGKIVTARKGVGMYRLTAHGRPSHAGSRHAEGRSAILELARQIVAIEGMTDYDRGVTFNVGLVSGGTGSNVRPQMATATIDFRVTSVADAQEFDARIRALQPFDPEVRLEIVGEINRLPFEKTDGVARLLTHARQIAAEIGFTLEDVSTGGASDGNFIAANVPCLDGLGVDGDGAHTLDEHLYISSLEPRLQLLKRLMQSLA